VVERDTYLRKFNLCRICFRELANKGELPGIKKSIMVNDPIADMLTRIRNAKAVAHNTVTIPFSNLKLKIS